MARRVDSEGYLINMDGTRLPENQQGRHEGAQTNMKHEVFPPRGGLVHVLATRTT